MAINIIDINVKNLIPNPNNPRKDVGDVTELADSIKEQGLQQALVVTPDHEEHGERMFRVVIGHRRLAACKLAGIERVPCIVREMDVKTERELMLVENCQRSDLTPLEEADGYQGLLDLGAGVGELAAKTGRSESFVRGRLRIARIPAEVRSGSDAFAQLSLSQLDDLAEFEAYPDMMAELASMAGTKNWDWKRGQLRSRVRVEAWQQSMRTALEALGLTVDVSASTWTTPEGYRYYNTWSGEPDEFKQWYGQWREKNPYGQPIIRFSDCTVLCFPQLSPEEIAERDAKSERREREKAAFQEALAARKEFDRLAYTLRTDWIRKHATGFNGGLLRKATTRLSLLALTGTELCHGLISGASWNNIDNVLAAYNLLAATPLPYDDTSDRELWHEQNLTELHRRQHVEGAANRELLLILCAPDRSTHQTRHMGRQGRHRSRANLLPHALRPRIPHQRRGKQGTQRVFSARRRRSGVNHDMDPDRRRVELQPADHARHGIKRRVGPVGQTLRAHRVPAALPRIRRRIRPHGRALAERQRTAGGGAGGRGNARTGARRRPVDGGRGRHPDEIRRHFRQRTQGEKSQGRACRRRRFGRVSAKQTRSKCFEAKPKQTMKQTVKQTVKQNRSKRLKQNEAIASKQTKQPVLT